jgi:hypothetical protein
VFQPWYGVAANAGAATELLAAGGAGWAFAAGATDTTAAPAPSSKAALAAIKRLMKQLQTSSSTRRAAGRVFM